MHNAQIRLGLKSFKHMHTYLAFSVLVTSEQAALLSGRKSIALVV